MNYQQQLERHYSEVHKRLIGTTKVESKKVEEKPIKPTPPPPVSPSVPKLSPLITEINRPSLSQLIWLVCHKENIALKDFASPRKLQQLVYARQIFYYLAYRYTGAGLTAIGRKVGNRDHSTIAQGIRRVRQRIEQLPQWRDHIDEYRTDLSDYEMNTMEGPCPFCGREGLGLAS